MSAFAIAFPESVKLNILASRLASSSGLGRSAFCQHQRRTKWSNPLSSRPSLTRFSATSRTAFHISSNLEASNASEADPYLNVLNKRELPPNESSRTPEVEKWAENLFAPETDEMRTIRDLAAKQKIPPIALGPAEAKLLSLLLRLHKAKKVVEIGTLFGLSATSIARSLPDDGHLWTLERNQAFADVASKVFEITGMSSKIDVVVGDALSSLSSIEPHGPFDAIFIDADKVGYPKYLTWAEAHVRKGGLIIGDNTYYFGEAHLDPATLPNNSKRASIEAMQEFNGRLADDSKYFGVMLPTVEGMTVAIKLF